MMKWRICKGEHVYSFYFVPTIEYSKGNGYEYLCIDFLKWYIGIIK